MKALYTLLAYCGIALAVYALIGISQLTTLGNTAMLALGVAMALTGWLKAETL